MRLTLCFNRLLLCFGRSLLFLQNRVMQVPGRTHIMKIQWNFSSVLKHRRGETFPGPGGRGVGLRRLPQVGQVHRILLWLAVLPSHKYKPTQITLLLWSSSFFLVHVEWIVTLTKERRNGNPCLLYKCANVLHRDSYRTMPSNITRSWSLSLWHIDRFHHHRVSKYFSLQLFLVAELQLKCTIEGCIWT